MDRPGLGAKVIHDLAFFVDRQYLFLGRAEAIKVGRYRVFLEDSWFVQVNVLYPRISPTYQEVFLKIRGNLVND